MGQELLEMLLSETSVSGEEFVLQDMLEKHMKPFADICERDSIGDGVYTVFGSGDRKILLAAHIDEIGLMITGATSEGFLKVINAGGIKPILYPGHSVKIQTQNGVVYGSVVVDSDAMKKENFSFENLLLDIGATSKEEALTKVRIGDTAAPDSTIRRLMNDRILARGLDDKTGVYVIMEALKRIKKQGSPNTVIAAATAGEETDMHGAKWVAERKYPDEAIIVDVTYTSDYDGMRSAKWGEISLGKGPALCINPICDKQMNRRFMEIAEKEGIPYQIEVSSGRSCTDADEIHVAGMGIPVALVSIPLRYMHSPAEVADSRDLENAIRLLTEYLMSEKKTV